MICLTGGAVVLSDRVDNDCDVLIDGDRIVAVGSRVGPKGSETVQIVDVRGRLVAPGFVDVHVHGLEGRDALEGADAIDAMAARLPRYGVTAFCPTSVACTPRDLRRMLDAVRVAREPSRAAHDGGSSSGSRRARVLGAHLESNFINPDYRGAQPLRCLRRPPRALDAFMSTPDGSAAGDIVDDDDHRGADVDDFSAEAILLEVARAREHVAIVTIAPELDAAIDLVRALTSRGHRVSLGHSGASYEEAAAAIAAGACHATHLFNRMPPLGHRGPGLAGAVLGHEEIAAEIICDGHHVHPAMVRVAVNAKGVRRMMAITDGTAGSGLPVGSRATLGGRPITVREVAYLDDGVMAGSVLTMDGALRTLVRDAGLSLADASALCSTTPARELGLVGHGVIQENAVADLVVLDDELRVVQTWIGGERW